MYWFAVAALVLATVTDLRRREIPDGIPVGLFSLALGAKCLGLHPAEWWDIGLGAGAAFALSAALFAAGGLGGGDVKLLAALGAALGGRALLPFVLVTAIVGGLVALVLRRRGVEEIAYAPVMLAGLLALLPLVLLAS